MINPFYRFPDKLMAFTDELILFNWLLQISFTSFFAQKWFLYVATNT